MSDQLTEKEKRVTIRIIQRYYKIANRNPVFSYPVNSAQFLDSMNESRKSSCVKYPALNGGNCTHKLKLVGYFFCLLVNQLEESIGHSTVIVPGQLALGIL